MWKLYPCCSSQKDESTSDRHCLQKYTRSKRGCSKKWQLSMSQEMNIKSDEFSRVRAWRIQFLWISWQKEVRQKRQLYICTFSNNHFSHKVVKFLQFKVYQKWLLNCLMSSSLDKRLLLLSRVSRVRPCATPQTEAQQAPLSLGFSRQKHWSGLPFPAPMHESEKWKGSHSVVSDSQRHHGLQPTRLLHPRDLPRKSTGVGCHCLLRIRGCIHTT